MKPILFIAVVLSIWASYPLGAGETLRIPAFTAYAEPDPAVIQPKEATGLDGWSQSTTTIVWHGRLENTGELTVGLVMRLPVGETVQLHLVCADKTVMAQVVGTGDQDIEVSLGTVAITTPGYQRFELHGDSRSGATFGRLAQLTLAGPASIKAHFNMLPRRNAASVHFAYPTPTTAQITAFYGEVTVREDPVWSYFMVCGFARGYFGIQVNSPTERRVIFSIWDSGKEAVDRKKVASEDRVTLLVKGDKVVASDFGNEGTGGHSHLIYPWVAGTTYKLLVTVDPQETTTRYSGYFYFPEIKRWGLIASFKAPKDGSFLHGLYSFNENFVGTNGDRRRLAEFGNQWIRTSDGTWTELLTARLTHDQTGDAQRLDYSAKLVDGRFALANGGFLDLPPTQPTLVRPALGVAPDLTTLPAVMPTGP